MFFQWIKLWKKCGIVKKFVKILKYHKNKNYNIMYKNKKYTSCPQKLYTGGKSYPLRCGEVFKNPCKSLDKKEKK